MGDSCPPPSSYAPEKNVYAETFQTRGVVSDQVGVTGANILILHPWWRPHTNCWLTLHIAIIIGVYKCYAF